MNQMLEEKCKLFVANKEVIGKQFKWDSSYVIPTCGMLFAEKNVLADGGKMQHCNELLKKNTDMFSYFRGNTKLVIVSKMALSDNPQIYLNNIKIVYDLFKKAKLPVSEFTALAATLIADNKEITDPGPVVDKAADVYRKMKQNHPFLTSSEDMTFATLLAMNELPVDAIMQEMEACYRILSPHFLSSNAVQCVSHNLALDPRDAQTKCREVLAFRDMLKQCGLKYDSSGLAMLGGLITIRAEKEAIVSDIAEVDAYLRKQSGFGAWGVGGYMRLVFATSLVINSYEMSERMKDSAGNQTIAVNSTVAAMNSSATTMMAMQTTMQLAILSAAITTTTVN